MRWQLTAFLWIQLAVTLFAQGEPEWIWGGEAGFESSQSFELEAIPEWGMLRATADFAEMEVFLNDRRILALAPFDAVAEIELRSSDFRLGENALELRTRSHAGPSAVAVSLVVDELLIETDGSWGVPSLGKVRPERFRLGDLAELTADADYNQWKEAKLGVEGGGEFSVVPSGAAIELLRKAKPEEDSWVSLEFDPNGRLIVARETRGLLRFTLAGDAVSEVEVIDDTLEECRGLLWANDSLYANANNSKALFRLQDTTGDDRFDEITELIATEGGVGHGRNDLALGPDGHIYAIHGDSVKYPERAVILPASESSEPQGFLLRTNVDGSESEIVARGLRNPYGIAFNPDGEAFTYDADHERDLGLPLYRPTQITHLVDGANYGWWQEDRSETSWPISAPDGWPATVYLGRGSPTAVKFRGPALYALDWAYGRIVEVTLIPRGASYYGSAETWLQGRPLNVTDLEFRGDTLYFITGGRKTQSALYRVNLPPIEPLLETEQSRRRADYSAEQRLLRNQISAGKVTPIELWAALGSYDPFLRNAARRRVELDPALMETLLHRSPDSLASYTLRLAQARLDPGDTELHEALRRHIPASGQLAQLTWVRSLERVGGLSNLTFPEPASREVAKAFCSIRVAAGDPAVIPEALKYLANATDQRDRLYFLEQLSLAKVGWTEPDQRGFALALLNAKRFAKGDRDLPEFITRVEAAARENLPNPEILTGILSDDTKSLETEVEPRPFVKHWTMADFLDEVPTDPASSHEVGVDLFTAARCVHCHQHGDRGNPIGPNLTAVGNRFSRMDLLRSILEPSHVIAEGYETHRITRTDGTEVIGRIVRDDLRESVLHLATNPFASTSDVTLPKSELAAIESLPISPMPAGLLSTLKRQEIERLLDFLLQDGSLSGLPDTSVSF